ncbi:MAG: hypothetical protein U1F29_02375 [Planctomycetota bacterium]
MNTVAAHGNTTGNPRREQAALDASAWRAAWKFALACFAFDALHGALTLGLDPSAGDAMRERARATVFSSEAVLMLPLSAIVGGLLAPLVGLVVGAWIPSKLSDAKLGKNRDTRWAWGLGGLFLPLLATGALRAAGVHGIVLNGPGVPWLWPTALALFTLHGLCAWWMLRKHGFLAAWGFAWAVAAVEAVAVQCVAWSAFGAAA